MEEIIDTTNKLLRSCKASDVEVEARVRRQIVTKHSARLLLDNLDGDWEATSYSERRKISKNNRKCTYRSRVGEFDNETICKSSITKVDVNDMWCTVHISVEASLPSMSHALDAVLPVEVTRHRTKLEGHYVDLIFPGDEEPRVEVETCNAERLDLDAMMRVVTRVCTALQGNAKFVPYYDWKSVMHIAGTPFGPFCIDRKQYQKPRTMTVDVLYQIAADMRSWTVTPKVDGTRRFIVTVNGRAFSLGTAKDVTHGGQFDRDTITVLDCEFADNTYYAFDIPVDNGEYCGNLCLDQRILRMEAARQALHGMQIFVKPYETFGSFDNLHEFYDIFLEKHAMDGLIFAHANVGYMQPVPKWKMHSTVDLLVVGDTLSTCDGFDMDIKCSGLPKGSFGVWEFAYEDEALVAKRQRPDKQQANSKHIVTKNMFDSVPGTLFTGKGFYLMRKYHNRIKRQALIDANDANATIFDIGTGQGGDVGKWRRASSVFCIEPNVDSLYEMHSRCSDELWSKITAINARLADVNLEFIDKKIDVFTAFFCMNQFDVNDWNTLKNVVKTKGSKKCRLLAIALTDPKEHSSSNLDIETRGNDKYNIKMHDTRIMDIDETAVRVPFLNKLMNKCNMKLAKQERLDNDDFMTKDERKLSAMYTLFVYKK